MTLMPRSLSGRLILGALALVLVTVVSTGIAMDFALRRFIQGQIDGRLDGQILSVTDALRNGPDGSLRLERIVDGPPFERPLSGWYWEVLAPGTVLRSTSLQGLDFSIVPEHVEDRPKPTAAFGRGPRGEPLRVRVRNVGRAGVVLTIAATAPLEALTGPRREALAPVAVLLAVLATILVAGVFIQVRLGLRPLASLRRELNAIRAGRSARVTGAQPAEIGPLVADLNTLLEQNAVNLERARRHVANLAHGLKTPLATLALVLEEQGENRNATLVPLVALMDRRIRHHLARARAAALGGPERAGVGLAVRIDDHLSAFKKLYADKHLLFQAIVDPSLAVACDPQDVDEILGNLIENACRWANCQLVIEVRARDRLIEIRIEDDGPGLTPSDVAKVLRRGNRLDETTSGYGFGLPIAQELVELYGGSITLEGSRLGGLRVVLTLPIQPD